MFIRSRRESLRPGEVGLPEGPRRRTPGLRRAELATLADISVDYLTRLEQGRDTHPSTQVLASLAGALRLDEEDLDHLRRLAVISNDTELCPAAQEPTRAVRPTVRTLLEALEPVSAVVLNHQTDLLAWTDGYDRLVRPLGLLDGDEPNLTWFAFADERARAVYLDWEGVADQRIADLRAGLRGHPDDDPFAARLSHTAGASFRDRWADATPIRARTGVTGIAHPEVGVLRLAYETLDLPDPEGQRLVVYLPADAATSTGLDRLSGREPGALRAVTSG